MVVAPKVATATIKSKAIQKKRVTKKRTNEKDPMAAEANGKPKLPKKQVFTREELIDEILGPTMREKSDKVLEEKGISRSDVPNLETEELRRIRRIAYRRFCSSRKCQSAKNNSA